MSVFSDLRSSIAQQLTDAGIHAFTTLPDRWAPPGAFVGPADPYITRVGANFGGEIVRHQITLVATRGANEKRADDLDQMITDALDALYELNSIDVGDVDLPGQISIKNQPYLAVAITVTSEIHR